MAKTNALFLCNEILEPIREHFKCPLIITSGYREAQYNKAIGGTPTSQHLYNEGDAAVDFFLVHIPIRKVFDWLRLESGLPFDQVILESKNGTPNVIHITINRFKVPRRVAMTGSVAGMLNGNKYEKVDVA